MQVDNLIKTDELTKGTKLSYYGTVYTRLERPCKHHKLAFPSSDITKYPEIRNIDYFLCKVCGWFVSKRKGFYK